MEYHLSMRVIHVTKQNVQCGENGAKVWVLIVHLKGIILVLEADFIVAIAHGVGVVLCEQYVELFTGAYSADFIR